jgi:hypothetical protein
MRKMEVGSITVGRDIFWSLIYADDIMLVADKEENMKTTM